MRFLKDVFIIKKCPSNKSGVSREMILSKGHLISHLVYMKVGQEIILKWNNGKAVITKMVIGEINDDNYKDEEEYEKSDGWCYQELAQNENGDWYCKDQ